MAQAKKRSLPERHIEKSTYLESSSSISLKSCLMVRFWTEKTSSHVTYGDQWPMTNDLSVRQITILLRKCRNTNRHHSSGICSSIKHQNSRCFGRLCMTVLLVQLMFAESRCLSHVRQRVHHCWFKIKKSCLLGMWYASNVLKRVAPGTEAKSKLKYVNLFVAFVLLGWINFV